MESELTKIGISCLTDKAFWHGYTWEYEKYFAPLKDKYLNILELGIAKGASLRMLETYFKNANIYGIDINDAKIYETDRIHIYKGSQSSQEDLERILADCFAFDIIIDDGSHLTEDQLFSFYFLFDYVKSGGIYICEDIDFAQADKYSFMKLAQSFDQIGMIVHGWKDMEREIDIGLQIKTLNIFTSDKEPILCWNCHGNNVSHKHCKDCGARGLIGTTCIIVKSSDSTKMID